MSGNDYEFAYAQMRQSINPLIDMDVSGGRPDSYEVQTWIKRTQDEIYLGDQISDPDAFAAIYAKLAQIISDNTDEKHFEDLKSEFLNNQGMQDANYDAYLAAADELGSIDESLDTKDKALLAIAIICRTILLVKDPNRLNREPPLSAEHVKIVQEFRDRIRTVESAHAIRESSASSLPIFDDRYSSMAASVFPAPEITDVNALPNTAEVLSWIEASGLLPPGNDWNSSTDADKILKELESHFAKSIIVSIDQEKQYDQDIRAEIFDILKQNNLTAAVQLELQQSKLDKAPKQRRATVFHSQRLQQKLSHNHINPKEETIIKILRLCNANILIHEVKQRRSEELSDAQQENKPALANQTSAADPLKMKKIPRERADALLPKYQQPPSKLRAKDSLSRKEKSLLNEKRQASSASSGIEGEPPKPDEPKRKGLLDRLRRL